jgi:hypothetical protein
MPRFDGTGPQGLGPMTGRGAGYCAMALPSPGTANVPYGYAGLAGVPLRPYGAYPAYGRPRLGAWVGRGAGYGRGRSIARGRGGRRGRRF